GRATRDRPRGGGASRRGPVPARATPARAAVPTTRRRARGVRSPARVRLRRRASNSEALHLLEEPAVRDPERLGRVRLVAAAPLDRRLDLLALDVLRLPPERAGRRAVERRLLDVLGERVLADRLAGLGHEDGALELVGQLAHVAGKWVAGEERQRLRRRSLDVLSNLRGHAPHEMARERGHVLEPLAERRDADREDAEPVVEVLAEPAGLHLVLEAAVRRRDDAHVDLPGVIVPDLPDLAVLEDAEQLRLQL